MPVAAVRDALRGLFAAWGLPARVRVDNGAPWGGWSDLPTDLELWLAGVGVGVHHNRPRRCQENARVERTHGVLARWADPVACPDAPALQARLAAASRFQRAGLPVRRLDRRTRADAFPALAAGGRPFDPAAEDAAFDAARAHALLAGMAPAPSTGSGASVCTTARSGWAECTPARPCGCGSTRPPSRGASWIPADGSSPSVPPPNWPPTASGRSTSRIAAPPNPAGGPKHPPAPRGANRTPADRRCAPTKFA